MSMYVARSEIYLFIKKSCYKFIDTRFNISMKINTLLQLVLFYHESFHGIVMWD